MSVIYFGDAGAAAGAPTSASDDGTLKLSVKFKYKMAGPPEIRDPRMRLHVWTNVPNPEQPFVVVPFARGEEERSFEIAVGEGATFIVAEVHVDQLADNDGATVRPIVPGQGRGKCALLLTNLSRKGTLVFEEFGHRQVGELWMSNATFGFRFPWSPKPDPAVRSDCDSCAAGVPEIIIARSYGKDIAALGGPIEGIEPAAPGLKRIDCRYWDDPFLRTPGWLIMKWKPVRSESVAFVENALRIAAERRGTAQSELETLAKEALDDITAGDGTEEEPQAGTVLFAVIVAEAAHCVASSAHYMTDTGDTNTVGERWRASNVLPIEQFSSMIRVARSGDCEDFSKEVCEFYRGLLGVEGDSPLASAAKAVASCYVPMMTLGQVYRPSGSGAQYDMGDGCNAHAWGMLLSTSALDIALTAAADKLPGDRPPAHLSSEVKKPWKVGLPTMLVDGTMFRELYPRVFEAYPERKSVTTLPQPLRGIASEQPFARVCLPMNFDYYKTIKTVYIPYGVTCGETNRPVNELVFYGNISRDGMSPDPLYGAVMDEIFRLPHITFSPEKDAAAGMSRPPTSGAFVAAYPSYVPTAEDEQRLAPLVALFHPLPPYAAPLPADAAACAAVCARFADILLKKTGIKLSPKPPAGVRGVSVRHRDALVVENLQAIIDTAFPKLCLLSPRSYVSSRKVKSAEWCVAAKAHAICEGERELTLWVWKK